MDHSVHFWLLLVPALLVVGFRFRQTWPLLLVVVVLHVHTDPLPGSASPTPPPMCCAQAQSLEAVMPEPVVQAARVARAPRSGILAPPFEVFAPVVRIRAPPCRRVFLSPVSLTPFTLVA